MQCSTNTAAVANEFWLFKIMYSDSKYARFMAEGTIQSSLKWFEANAEL